MILGRFQAVCIHTKMEMEVDMPLLMLHLCACFLALVFSVEPALAGNNTGVAFSVWPDTGQNKCYEIDGHELDPCPAEGQPFYGQDAQYAGPSRSYTKLDGEGNVLPESSISYAMVRDNVTGLIWEMKEQADGLPDYSNPHDADNTYTWCDSNSTTNGGNPGVCETNDTDDFIGQLNAGAGLGGHNDWRLPTIKELATLSNRFTFAPAIDPIFAAALPAMVYRPETASYPLYWSSTTSIGDNSNAWAVQVLSGHIEKSNTYKSEKQYVRAVRGMQLPEINRFVLNQSGTVIADTVTCLEWQYAPMNLDGSNGADKMTLSQALAAAEVLSLDGRSDWRLPDINELYSIIDFNQYNPAIYPIFLGAMPASDGYSYWSSTTTPIATEYVRTVGFTDGSDTGYTRDSQHLVRAVRGSQCRHFLPGDCDNSGSVDLRDAIMALQIGAGQTPSVQINVHADVNSDNRIGIAECIYTLQAVAAE